MDSKGNSFGEGEPGNDLNKANLNFLIGTADHDINGIQNLSLCSDAQVEMTKSTGDHVRASAVEEYGAQSTARQLLDTSTDTFTSRQSKPVLEIGNGLTRSCYNSYNKGVLIENENSQPSSVACLTMSLGLYDSKDYEPDRNGLSALNISGMLGSPFEPYNETERHALKLLGMNPMQANPSQILHKQPQMQQQSFLDASKSASLSRPLTPKEPATMPIRVARPPVEGRGRNQLLPRYWPRITDQELQQITAGDSNSTIIPLFEKMLSASDAGRIGRLVLPKACAEAYFPPISQPEGLPLKIQDVSGKDWVFQFRFWPNNNSRMYVLEGVTPCIQSMHLQAGDTVTFSRLDPEGKLVMGYRRAPTSLSSQEAQPSIGGPGTAGTSNSMKGMGNANMDTFSSIASITDLLSQSARASELQANGNHGHLSLSDTGYGWYKPDKGVYKAKEGSFFPSMLTGDKKKSRPANSKTRRPYTDMNEAAQFRISWEEAQDLLRSPPNAIPSIITIEGFDFEEYEEPPVFGKRTIFTMKECSPGEDQWVQCDDCSNWRKVPSDVFLPSRWVCNDNVWDADRNFCSAPQEVENEEIEFLVQQLKEVSKVDRTEPFKGNETSLTGLEALANAATGAENNVVSSSPPAAATTKHPRHRPGCTCIVCIQPPSGKGPKHNPTCSCNVCMTVKRRFKTLMMRRKKRQSEREAEHAARKKRPWIKEDGDANDIGKYNSDGFMLSESVAHQGNLVVGFPSTLPTTDSFPNMNRFFPSLGLPTLPYPPRGRSLVDDPKAHIDLNTQPERYEEANKSAFRVSMVRLLQSAMHPLESYLKEQGLPSLRSHQQITQSSLSFSRNNAEREPDIHFSYSQTSAMVNPERSQDVPQITLGMPRFDTSTG